jgi:hypothetical protein
MRCYKCEKLSGNDWQQCGRSCPRPESPFFSAYETCSFSQLASGMKDKEAAAIVGALVWVQLNIGEPVFDNAEAYFKEQEDGH